MKSVQDKTVVVEKSEKIEGKTLYDRMIYFIAFFGPAMTLPQIWQIFSTKSAQSVSLTTWCAYLTVAIFWISYGFKIKDKPIIINNLLWAIFELLVIIGVLIY